MSRDWDPTGVLETGTRLVSETGTRLCVRDWDPTGVLETGTRLVC